MGTNHAFMFILEVSWFAFRSLFMTRTIRYPKLPTLCYVFQEVNAGLQQENRTMEKEVFIFVRFPSSLEKDGRKQSMSQPTK